MTEVVQAMSAVATLVSAFSGGSKPPAAPKPKLAPTSNDKTRATTLEKRRALSADSGYGGTVLSDGGSLG